MDCTICHTQEGFMSCRDCSMWICEQCADDKRHCHACVVDKYISFSQLVAWVALIAMFCILPMATFAQPYFIKNTTIPGNYTVNLTAYWDFNGGVTESIVGYASTNTGVTFESNGVIGQNARFIDSESDRINITDDRNFSLIDLGVNDIPFTWAFWINVTDSTPGESVFFSKYHLTTPREYYIYIDATGLELLIRDSGGSVIRKKVDTTNINENLWNYVLVEYDGTQQEEGISIWINNNERAEVSSANTGYTGGFDSTIQPMIGALHNTLGNPTRFYDGGFDEFGIWRRVLDVNEKTQLYNNGNGFDPRINASEPVNYNQSLFGFESVVGTVNFTGGTVSSSDNSSNLITSVDNILKVVTFNYTAPNVNITEHVKISISNVNGSDDFFMAFNVTNNPLPPVVTQPSNGTAVQVNIDLDRINFLGLHALMFGLGLLLLVAFLVKDFALYGIMGAVLFIITSLSMITTAEAAPLIKSFFVILILASAALILYIKE